MHPGKIICFLFLLFSSTAVMASRDSIGIQEIEGKQYIVHEIQQGQDLGYLSDRYGVSKQAIRDANPDVSEVKVFDFLLVPYKQDDDKEAVTDETDASAPDKPEESEAPSLAEEAPADESSEIKERSIDIRESERKTHKVEEGETLFRISRTYDVTIAELQEWNGLDDYEISPGQELYIAPPPGDKPEGDASDKSPEIEEGADKDRNTHIVESGETLFSISRQYDISVNALMEWNDLDDHNLSTGQQLFVEPAKEPSENDDEAAEGNSLAEQEDNSFALDMPQGYRAFEEQGKAGWLQDNRFGAEKSLAVHASAPIGTIIRVTNLMNNRSAYVRVVGQLPDTPDNEDLIIKISKGAAEKLDVRDPYFRAELRYAREDNS